MPIESLPFDVCLAKGDLRSGNAHEKFNETLTIRRVFDIILDKGGRYSGVQHAYLDLVGLTLCYRSKMMRMM